VNSFQSCINELEHGNGKNARDIVNQHGLNGDQVDKYNRSLLFHVIFALYKFERPVKDSENLVECIPSYEFDDYLFEILEYILDNGANINQHYCPCKNDPHYYEYSGVSLSLYATWMSMAYMFPHRLRILKFIKSYKKLDLYKTKNLYLTSFFPKIENPMEFLKRDWDEIEVSDFKVGKHAYDAYEQHRSEIFKILYPDEWEEISEPDRKSQDSSPKEVDNDDYEPTPPLATEDEN
jgi:hypothetical protein